MVGTRPIVKKSCHWIKTFTFTPMSFDITPASLSCAAALSRDYGNPWQYFPKNIRFNLRDFNGLVLFLSTFYGG